MILIRSLYALLTVGLSMAFVVDIQDGHTIQAIVDAIFVLGNMLYLIFAKN